MMIQPRATLLASPVADGGLSSTNFFNGQLLTGEDLTAEQTANRLARLRLGRALGSGIVAGLEVTLGPGSTASVPVVTVQPGSALSRSGQMLSLNRAADVSLQAPSTQSGGFVANPGQGVYVLSIAPDQVQQGALPVASPGSAATCTARYTVEAVRFELLQLNVDPFDLLPENQPLLRNLIAHECFGSDDPQLLDMRTDPFGPPPPGYGLLDDLRPDILTDDHVPLAVMHWDATTSAGLTFVDMWSVRRSMRPPELTTRWTSLFGSRRHAEGEAMFLQFQDQLQDLRVSADDVTRVRARDHFRYLPPVGLLPVDPSTTPAAGPVPTEAVSATEDTPAVGFQHEVFFAGQTWDEPVFIDGAVLEPLIRGAQAYAPIDLQSGELIWLYWVRENRSARAGLPATAAGPQPFIVFTSGHVPYQGDSRFDLAHFGYSSL